MRMYGQEKNIISRVEISKPKTNVHIYEIQERTFTTIIRNPSGEVIQVQTLKGDQVSYKVIYNGLTTIVILSDGSKGIAKCNPKDKYIRQIGHDIAHKRARIKQLEKQIEELSKEGR